MHDRIPFEIVPKFAKLTSRTNLIDRGRPLWSRSANSVSGDSGALEMVVVALSFDASIIGMR